MCCFFVDALWLCVDLCGCVVDFVCLFCGLLVDFVGVVWIDCGFCCGFFVVDVLLLFCRFVWMCCVCYCVWMCCVFLCVCFCCFFVL